MKRLTLIMTILIVFNSHAGWIDDWVDQSSSNGPSYFDGQKRGYFNGGYYSARFRNRNDYLFSIQKPKLKSGCGGIDLFMGGFTFLDPEYLMEKLQKALQAAPAIAFDLALKELCQDCSATLGKFESIINSLNNVQLGECGMAKEIATTVMGEYEASEGGFSETLSLIDSKLSAINSASKNYTNSKEEQANNNNKPTQEQKEAIAGCSTEFKNIFAREGSVLEHIAESKGLEEYADYMRAYLGDIIINYTDKQFGFNAIGSCDETTVEDIDNILIGNAMVKTINGDSCVRSGDQGLFEIVDTHLHSIATKITNKNGSYSSKEINFLNSMPLPIYNALTFAIQTNNVDAQIDVLREPTARVMSYAIIDDLVNKIYELIRIATAEGKQASKGNNSGICTPEPLAPILDVVQSFKEDAVKLSIAVKKVQSEQISLYVNSNEFAASIKNNADSYQEKTNKEQTR